MKQKDLGVIIIVVIASAIVSVVASKYIFAKPSNREQKVETVGAITSTFTQPSNVYFNSSSIDPTQTIQVNLGTNTAPFGNSSQVN